MPVLRYVITHVDGLSRLRQLTFEQQGRATYETPREALRALALFRPDLTEKVLGFVVAASLEVRPCECHDGHFDPVGRYFEGPERTLPSIHAKACTLQAGDWLWESSSATPHQQGSWKLVLFTEVEHDAGGRITAHCANGDTFTYTPEAVNLVRCDDWVQRLQGEELARARREAAEPDVDDRDRGDAWSGGFAANH